MRVTEEDATQRIECFCSRRPLLARAGATKKGQPFVWIKTKRGDKVLVDAIATVGPVYITCRECNRQHCVTVVPSGVRVTYVTEDGMPNTGRDPLSVG